MNPEMQRLIEAYRRQEELYERVVKLVRDQCAIMNEEPDPAEVLEICKEIDALLGQIADIEQDLEGLKENWEDLKDQVPEELDGILGRIEDYIKEITEKQDSVRVELLEYMCSRERSSNDVQASVNANRARSAYGSD